jgi:hypothetical protein
MSFKTASGKKYLAFPRGYEKIRQYDGEIQQGGYYPQQKVSDTYNPGFYQGGE